MSTKRNTNPRNEMRDAVEGFLWGAALVILIAYPIIYFYYLIAK